MFAAVILLSGMHLTISRHQCYGEAATFEKVSFSGELASCGMETNDSSSLPDSFFKTHCCDNSASVLKVDSNYAPSFNLFKIFAQTDWQVMELPAIYRFSYNPTENVDHTNVLPPGDYLASAVSLPRICVFLI